MVHEHIQISPQNLLMPCTTIGLDTTTVYINTKTIKTNIITGKSKVTDNKKEGKKEGKLLTNGSPLRSNPTSSPSLEVWNSSANLTTSPITGSGTFLSIERRNLCKDKKN